MRLVVLNDNVPAEGLINDWGWSVLVEGKERFIFDADTNPLVLAHNSKALGVSLKGLDFTFLSHWHYDHYGGLPYIAELNPGIKLYAPPGNRAMALRRGFDSIGVFKAGEIADGVWTSGPLEDFEQALGMETASGLIVIVGCSHPGVDRLTRAILDVSGYDRAYLVIGGFHGPSKRTLDRLAEMADFIAPAHCSGDFAKEYVRRTYPEKFVGVKTGTIIEL
ncbi:MBL fold hydrolase [Thermococcus profundus]|uniref:MBL fold hydrolase n=1 Tax=Thermococcus profundus TaxID=49899 RepID=A0A2Z2MFD6_THEPR|nr:MBL fold metallo-hydrolase [Thermococcus profundus]ASJ03452.1 MBL fold hydrolase [Thermococcus profundus]